MFVVVLRCDEQRTILIIDVSGVAALHFNESKECSINFYII